jgi:hypothetical protein
MHVSSSSYDMHVSSSSHNNTANTGLTSRGKALRASTSAPHLCVHTRTHAHTHTHTHTHRSLLGIISQLAVSVTQMLTLDSLPGEKPCAQVPLIATMNLLEKCQVLLMCC